MRVQTGPKGQKMVTVHFGNECYLDTQPHALKPEHIYVEYVRAGRVLSTIFMKEEDALALLVDTVRNTQQAQDFRRNFLQGPFVHYRTVREIPVFGYRRAES